MLNPIDHKWFFIMDYLWIKLVFWDGFENFSGLDHHPVVFLISFDLDNFKGSLSCRQISTFLLGWGCAARDYCIHFFTIYKIRWPDAISDRVCSLLNSLLCWAMFGNWMYRVYIHVGVESSTYPSRVLLFKASSVILTLFCRSAVDRSPWSLIVPLSSPEESPRQRDDLENSKKREEGSFRRGTLKGP